MRVLKQDNGVIEGELIGLRYAGGKERAFEMLLDVEEAAQGPNTTIWLGSEVIRDIGVRNPLGNWKFIFALESLSKESPDKPNTDS